MLPKTDIKKGETSYPFCKQTHFPTPVRQFSVTLKFSSSITEEYTSFGVNDLSLEN